MRLHTGLAALCVACAALALSGCFGDLTSPRHENQLDPDNPGTVSVEPDRPVGLSAVIADRRVELSWSMPDTVGVAGYKVYRWDMGQDEEETYELQDTVEARRFVDTEVLNGQQYSYRVSAVNELGLEGLVSRAVATVPAIYGVTIAGGRTKTAARDVTLTMSAPATTTLMRIANGGDASSAPWVTYQPTYAWELTPGDGGKTVTAQFRDASDSQSGQVVDSIELDTRATISSVTEDTGGEVQEEGDVIHFAVTAGEPFGEAWVDIGNVILALRLFDDGTGGDHTPNNGVYERDYEVELGIEVVNGLVTGGFIDEVGNEAAPVLAPGRVTIEDPPSPAVLDQPVTLSETSIALSWSRNNDPDFDRYKLYRSYVPGVGTSTERLLLAELIDPAETEYTDVGLRPDSTYYYAVYVVDAIWLSSISNEVSGTTLANAAPAPVVLYPPEADTTSLRVSWAQSGAEDFEAYELFSWEQDPPNPPNTSLKRIIARLSSPGETFFTHGSLVDTLVYWYEVAVVDSFGARAVSNAVSGSVRPSLR